MKNLLEFKLANGGLAFVQIEVLLFTLLPLQ
jgi:hypothetical protein